MKKTRKIPKRAFIAALNDSGGVINVIAKRLGCSWGTVRKAIEEDEELKELWLHEREKLLDICEATVVNAVSNGDVQAAKWVLATMGKSRGWGDNVEVSFNRDNRIIVEFVEKEDKNENFASL